MVAIFNAVSKEKLQERKKTTDRPIIFYYIQNQFFTESISFDSTFVKSFFRTRIRRRIKSAFSPSGTLAGFLQSRSAAAWTFRWRSVIASFTVRHRIVRSAIVWKLRQTVRYHMKIKTNSDDINKNQKSENDSEMKKNDLIKFGKMYIKIFQIINNFHSSE